MKNTTIVFHSFGHAVLVALYISGVSWVLFNGEKLLGHTRTFLVPFTMLLLFVLSATIVSTLVLGRPVLLYVNGSKREALQFFGCTVAWIFLVMLIALAFLRMSS